MKRDAPARIAEVVAGVASVLALVAASAEASAPALMPVVGRAVTGAGLVVGMLALGLGVLSYAVEHPVDEDDL